MKYSPFCGSVFSSSVEMNSSILRQERVSKGDIGGGVGRTLRGRGSGGRIIGWLLTVWCVSCFQALLKLLMKI